MSYQQLTLGHTDVHGSETRLALCMADNAGVIYIPTPALSICITSILTQQLATA